MVDSAERLINLALFLAGSPRPVTAEECRVAGLGYSEDQDDAAFARMFERDKDTLRAAGLPIESERTGETDAYRLDPSAFAAPVELTPGELATLAAAAAAMADDPGFPLAQDLRYALAKLACGGDALAAAGRLVDEAPAAQGDTAAVLWSAVHTRKRTGFGYTNLAGETGGREVEPYGLFLREGRWYLVGRDTGKGEVRTFTLARMEDVRVNEERPKSPDFERPEDFDVTSYVLLPFQYGPRLREASIRFSPEASWRAERLTAGQGTLEARRGGALVWRVSVSDEGRLLRWIVENGPGVTPLDADLRERLEHGLRKVVAAHGAR